MDKPAIRQVWRQRLQELDEVYITRSNAGILENLLALPEYRKAPRVFSYYSVGREVDTRAFLRCAQADGKELYLPVIQGTGEMVFTRFFRESDLTAGVLNIPEPRWGAPRACPTEEDLLVIPGLCFDGEGYRLGQGGGYYDRYLARHLGRTAGLCREALYAEAVPREPHDRPVTLLITESRVVRFPEHGVE